MSSILPRYLRRGVMYHSTSSSESNDVIYSLSLKDNTLRLSGSDGTLSTIELSQPDLSNYMKKDAIEALIARRFGSSSVLG